MSLLFKNMKEDFFKMAPNKNKTDDVLIPEEIKVMIGKEEVLITELPRKEYKKLYGIFGKVVEDLMEGNVIEIEDLQNIDNDISGILQYLGEDVLLEIEAIGSRKDPEWIENNIVMRQELLLVEAIYKVNHVGEIIENFIRLAKKIPILSKIINKYQKKLNSKQ